MPKLSVIVPVRNGARSLKTLLRSLEQQTLARDQFEVIICDNASTDDTVEVAARFGALVVSESVANRSRARNVAVSAARGDLFAFTDADCVATPQWLESFLRCAHLAPLVAGEVRVRTSHHPNAIERFEGLWRFAQEAWVKSLGWAATANLLVSREAFEAVGGFDPTWRHIGEDADFCLRAGSSGYNLAYCAEAIVEHSAEREVSAFLSRCFRHGYSANQGFYRYRQKGHRAWRDPLPALRGDRALRQLGQSSQSFESREWRRMARVARFGYAARILGSIWAELVRAR